MSIVVPTPPRRIAALLALAAAVGAWTLLAPPNFGGSTTYVSTHGISMEPSFHTGDLALVRARSTYRVGQIVAYRSHLLHTIVLHRIVARDGARYVFRGDNNSYRDPEHPTRDQLVGALWLHIPHGGMDIAPLRSPFALALVAGIAVLLLFNEGDKRRRRRRGGRPPATSVTETAALAFGGLLLVSLLAAIVAFARPTHVPSHRDVSYTQRGTFAYTASAPVGPVYPAGEAATGDPLFTSLVHSARVSFRYRFTSLLQNLVTGRIRLDAQLASTSGWRRSWRLAPPRAFRGSDVTVSAPLDVAALETLLDHVASATGSPFQSYTLTIRPHVTAQGVVGGALLDTRMAPALTLTVDPTRIAPATDTAFQTKKDGAASVSTSAARSLRLVKLSLHVSTLRVLALFGLIAGAAGLGWNLLVLFGGGTAETDRIRARFRDRLVAVAGSHTGDYTDVVDVESIDELARVAERYDRMILEHAGDYRVADDGVLYRYRVAPAK